MSTIKIYKPTTPGRRKTSVINYKEVLTESNPTKSLLKSEKNYSGRNKNGKMTVRHRGGGARKLIRQVDFKMNFPMGFKVLTVEYDPGRTGFVCLVNDIKSGEKKYILHTDKIEVGKTYGVSSEISNANVVVIGTVPVGTEISQVEMQPGQGAKLARSAGNFVTVTARDEKFTTIKLPSGEVRKVPSNSMCTIGKVGNGAHSLVRIGKAGRMRHMKRRPVVRGKVMNPVEHPHGGGEARNSIGLKYPKTKWGKHAIGVKTRNKKKTSNSLIVTYRNGRTPKK